MKLILGCWTACMCEPSLTAELFIIRNKQWRQLTSCATFALWERCDKCQCHGMDKERFPRSFHSMKKVAKCMTTFTVQLHMMTDMLTKYRLFSCWNEFIHIAWITLVHFNGTGSQWWKGNFVLNFKSLFMMHMWYFRIGNANVFTI